MEFGIRRYARITNRANCSSQIRANEGQDLLISTNKTQSISIELYDLMGRYLKTVYSGKVNAGETPIHTDVSNLPNSMYIYTIKLEDEVLNKKFIKQ